MVAQELIDPNTTKAGFCLNKPFNGVKNSCRKPINLSEQSTDSIEIHDNKDSGDENNRSNESKSNDKDNIKMLCETMRRQIISRAFYGWLAYCRHLRTVRTHLADLVNPKIISCDDPSDASGGITVQGWKSMKTSEGRIKDPDEVYRLIYFGGIEHSLRKTVWPYLLGHYSFDMSDTERQERDKEMNATYEMIMSEWLAVEAIVRQRDKEIVAANLAKLSSESNNSAEIPLTGPKDHNLSNDVFEDISEGDESRQSSRKSSAEIQKPISAARRQLQRLKQVESQGSTQNIIVTNASIDVNNAPKTESSPEPNSTADPQHLPIGCNEESSSQCVSPASSNGGVYTVSLN